jgi:hypothetical protein
LSYFPLPKLYFDLSGGHGLPAKLMGDNVMNEELRDRLIEGSFFAQVLCLARMMRDEAATPGEPKADVSKFIRPAVEEIDFYSQDILKLRDEYAEARSLRS